MTSISEFGLAMVTKNGNLYFRSNTSLAKNAKAEIQRYKEYYIEFTNYLQYIPLLGIVMASEEVDFHKIFTKKS